MNRSNSAPYTWEEIEDQVRKAILCQLSILRLFGPSSEKLGELYLGIDPDLLDNYDPDRKAGWLEEVLQSIPLHRHYLHRLARNAFAYAYQLDGCEAANYEDYHCVECALVGGFPQSDEDGEPSPLSSINDFPLRRMFETFIARWDLYNEEYDWGLSVRALSLLSNMTIPAVRTSLSKEGFKLDVVAAQGDTGRRDDDKSAKLSCAEALRWLSRRRGFVPNRVAMKDSSDIAITDILASPDLTFDQALQKAVVASGKNADVLASSIGTSPAWIESVVTGAVANIDVVALRNLARELRVSEPDFVAKAVRHLISVELAQNRQITD
ncbi:hypothetical protein LHP98_12960 [Rhodobacter sp. Har01]|uniref:hypothetical protein n=1 Tax=Rhodobacter sp. Har01 TaxID=2883999 RepID=UPI001D0909FF|nr:hypothetical protein [Rhodobacter sp. Har01]MCB6179035.1 hypothetical protein [Rhodobacter sp. Har01]